LTKRVRRMGEMKRILDLSTPSVSLRLILDKNVPASGKQLFVPTVEQLVSGVLTLLEIS
jgi:hypothetical protein